MEIVVGLLNPSLEVAELLGLRKHMVLHLLQILHDRVVDCFHDFVSDRMDELASWAYIR